MISSFSFDGSSPVSVRIAWTSAARSCWPNWPAETLTQHHIGRQPAELPLPFCHLLTRFSQHDLADLTDHAGVFCHRDELRRADRPARGMLPSGERFEADERSGPERNDRLVGDRQLVVVDRVAEIRLELQPIHRALAHGRVEKLDRRRAVSLRTAQGNRGVLQKVFRTVVARGADGDADGGRHEDLPSLNIERRAQRRPQALRHSNGVAGVADVVQQHREFVSAESGQCEARRVS